MSRTHITIAGALLIGVLVLSGCAAESTQVVDGEPKTTAPSSAPEAPTEPSNEPVSQEESCGWETSRLDSASAAAPTSSGDNISTAIIGAWQHTHIDSGAGFEAVKPTTDIRYVFPSTTRMLYCQDVAGSTSQAENAVNIEIDGLEIILPSPATGYAVAAWDSDTMVWTNHRDGSLYLLQRR